MLVLFFSVLAPVLTLAPHTSSMHARTHPYYIVTNTTVPRATKIVIPKMKEVLFLARRRNEELELDPEVSAASSIRQQQQQQQQQQ